MFDGMLSWLSGKAGLLASAAVLVLGVWLGWTANGWRWEARMAALEKTVAEETLARANAVSDAAERVRALEAQGDAAAARLLDAEAARDRISKEKDDAIRKQTAGRPCLDASVVGLLNDGSGSGDGLRLPAPAFGAALADSAFAADWNDPQPRSGAAPQGSDRWLWDSPSATDTDVALWANHARFAHDACRARIDALREFYEAVTP